jgi:two-component system nitrate/nitrite response regulator NarL
VADGQPLYRDALARVVRERPEFELVSKAADGREALATIGVERPDVAVLDRTLPELSGEQVLNALRRDGLSTRVLLIAAEPRPQDVYTAVADGAAGYVTKSADAHELCDAVAAVARGRTFVAPELHAGLAGEIRLREVRERPVMSDRERDILTLIAAGLTGPQIGRRLYLSPATVKTHLHHIYDKLGVSERAAAVAEAMRRGLLE